MTGRVRCKLGFIRKMLFSAVGVAVALPVLFVLLNACPSRAQQPSADQAGKRLRFEVASIRPHKSEGDPAILRPRRDGIRATNCPLTDLIANAYNSKSYGGNGIPGAPKWANSARYDIEAKVDASEADELGKLDDDQRWSRFMLMLQALLKDRFKLVTHEEPREVQGYALVVAKSGSKLKEGRPDDPTLPNGSIRSEPGQVMAKGVRISRLVDTLTRELNSPVLGKTGLTGTYDFTLQWTPDKDMGFSLPGDSSRRENPPPAESSGLSLFAALKEQLGLKLEPHKVQVEVLVIDHIERPSEN